VDAACAMAAFKYATLGYLGHTYEGMYDMHTDPNAIAGALGAHVKMLEMCELVKLTDTVSEDEIAEKIGRIRDTFEICAPSHDPITDYVQDADLEISARVACALDKLVEKNDLSGLAYYYKGEGNRYEEVAANMIIGNTILTSSGLPLAGEADLKTLCAMPIMNRIGAGGSFAEIHPFDTESEVVLIGHDGPHNIEIASRKPYLRKLKKFHGKAGSGIGVEFSIKSGPLTLLGFSVDGGGKLVMVAAKGTSMEGDIPQTGNTNTRVSFGCPVNEFLERWCEAGPTHHVALGCGDKIATLKKFSIISGIALTVVS
jgi:L-arabinose isomerase